MPHTLKQSVRFTSFVRYEKSVLKRQSVQKAEIVIQMRRVADAMKSLSEDMIYYGRLYDDPLFIHHGIDLMCASGLLADFQSYAEKEQNGK